MVHNFVTKWVIFTYIFSVVTDVNISQKAKCYSLSITQVNNFFVQINNSVNAMYIHVIVLKSRVDLRGMGRGGHDHSFFFENYFASFFIDK